MFKKIMYFVVIIAGIVVVVLGYRFYHSKLSDVASHSSHQMVMKSSQEKTSTSSSNQTSIDSANMTKYFTLLQNLPQTAQTTVENKVKNNKKAVLTLLVQDDNNVTKALKTALTANYGDSFWKVNVITYAQDTSSALLAAKLTDQVVVTHPDVILYEAPLLNDNLNISQDESTASNQAVLTALAQTKAAILVEPSNPIYNGKIYPTWNAAFKATLPAQYTYLDYWTNFPDGASDAMKALVVDDGNYRTLNEAGQKIWSDALIKTFTTK